MNRDRTWAALIIGILMLGGSTLPVRADILGDDAAEQIETIAGVTLGYRGVSTDDSPGRAREYDSFTSGPLARFKLFSDPGPYHLDLGLDYLNDNDYAAEAHLDTRNLLRLDLRTTRFFHNLDHIPYANGNSGDPAGMPPGRAVGSTAEGSRADALSNNAYRAYYSDQHPGEDYGLRLDMSEARLKIKAPDYPAHLALSFWRYEKTGDKQLRFVGENCATACHMQSRTRPIDRVTEEFKTVVDAHAGFFDIVLEGLLRTFRDHEPIPRDDFGTHTITGGKTFLDYRHDEDPDSSLRELTLKLNTAPSGGFVASAAFTVGERENRSDLPWVEATTDYSKASADVTYTPNQQWTFNLRYRLLDMDSDNSAVIKNYYVSGNPDMQVRDALDITRAWYEAVASYRPFKQLTLRAEVRREDIDRSNTGTPTTEQNGFNRTITDTWALPDEEIITRVKLGFSSRLLEKSALKLSGWLAFQNDDDPAYGTSFSQSQELFLAASYAPSPLWGIQTNINLLSQHSNDYETHDHPRDRKREQQNVTAGTWVNPGKGLSFDLNYGFLRSAIDQDLLFGTSEGYTITDNGVDYRQTVHSITAGVTWQALDNLSCRLEGYHTRAKADYSPDFNEGPFPYNIFAPPAFRYTGYASSNDLKQISELDLRQNGLRGRINWQIDSHWAGSAEVTFDNYDERGNDIYDGTAETAMVSLSRSW